MSGDTWVIVIGAAPSEPDSREMLELVLAGATLDCPMVVVFRGAGAAHLEHRRFEPWQQLVDFSLAEVFVDRSDAPVLPPRGVRTMDAEFYERLCREAVGVLEL